MESRRVLILSEPGLLAQGMRSLLEANPQIEIVGVTSDVRRAVEIIRDEHPNVILVDNDHFRLGLNHARCTIALESVSTLIAMSQSDNLVHVCRIEAKPVTALEDLMEAVSA